MSDRRKVLDLFEEQNDTWRKRAAEGIERYRKGDGVVTVVDEAGNPVSNAKIKLTQKTHEFRFGANLFMLDELESEEKNEKYKKYFLHHLQHFLMILICNPFHITMDKQCLHSYGII